MKRILIVALFAAVMTGCTTMKGVNDGETVTVTGTVEELGMTTFQYGTHLLKAENKSYALKSDKIQLDTFIGKAVSIKGYKVKGYPLEGGPELINVTLVKF